MSEPLVAYAPYAVGGLVAAACVAAAWRLVRWLDGESAAALDAIAPPDTPPHRAEE